MVPQRRSRALFSITIILSVVVALQTVELLRSPRSRESFPTRNVMGSFLRYTGLEVGSTRMYGHVHIAKTGGTSLNGMLANGFERVCGEMLLALLSLLGD